jgi:peptidyl-tRNA hydrolase, PTH1 family
LQRPSVIACLGNPGERYSMTWHNAGFWVGDILSLEAGVVFSNAGLFSVASLSDTVDVIKPTVYMNRSGRAVSTFLESVGLEPASLLVVCDDVNLPLGRLRLRGSGSSGGHNGLKDIIRCLESEDFSRLRMGVGPPPSNRDLADYVLEKVPDKLEEEASLMANRAADCVRHYIDSGLSSAQELYNRDPDHIP